jgi:uncharacterized protein involved in type VI secretion and phage assembly
VNVNSHRVGALHLGQVVDNGDPDGRGRLRVRLVGLDMELWCQTLAPSAGDGYGVSLLPRVEELVAVAFLGPDLPVVLGALWRADGRQPERAQPVEDIYLIRTPGGSEVRLDDSAQTVEVKTAAGYRVLIDEGNGEIKIERDRETISLAADGVEIRSASQVKIDAPTIVLSAGTVDIQAGTTQASGTVQCPTLMAQSVVGTTYSPGAGNLL